MASTTPARVRSIARHLAVLTDEQLQIHIDDAYQDVTETYKIKNESYHERLTRYLAAHLATLDVRRATSQRVSDMAKTFDSLAKGEGLKQTEYGQEFLRLLGQADGSKINLVVI
ncbi:MAG: hypothetical protein K0Q94_559 [Paenibacillus sp.]|jgi:hypothetical protein|nr:hypothetical protein [Paenibacillus sp.]